jgi:LCP family protein required for cell wall assembly
MEQNDILDEKKAPVSEQGREKPVKKLVRVNKSKAPQPPRQPQQPQVYHGMHEAPPEGENGGYAEKEFKLVYGEGEHARIEGIGGGKYAAGNIHEDENAPYVPKHEAPPEDYDDDYEYESSNERSWKDIIIKVASIVISLVIIAVMILNMPIIWFNDKRTGEKKNVSILYYLKNEQFLGYIEGNVDKTKHDPQINTDVVEPDYDDGLDLYQKIEGQYTVMFLGFDEEVANTDIIWLMQFDLRGGKLNILQVPRDTFAPDYTSSLTGKINSVYNLGRADDKPIQRVYDALEESFNIPIDAYITTVCTDVADMVDLVGGIPITLDNQIVYEADKIIPAGDTVLSGQQAEWFMRYRSGWSEGDIGRVQNQRRFMAAAMKKLVDIAGGSDGHAKLYKYLNEIYKHKWIATDMSVGDLTKLGDYASTISMDNITVSMVPGEGAWYAAPDGKEYSVYSVHKQETIDLLNNTFRPYQRPLLLSESSLIELQTNHLTDSYDKTKVKFSDLEHATEPRRG